MELGPNATRHARREMVSAADPLATTAALDVLADGGSAVDAAVCASAVLAVTSPHLCGMGGDLLALVHHRPGPPDCLDATGRAGSGADRERLLAAGHTAMPRRGDIAAVTVPGCVDGWLGLHDRHGRLDLPRILGPATTLAEEGFPASTLLALLAPTVADVDAAGAVELQAATHAGATVVRPGVARALRAVAAHGRDGFYLGEFGFGLIELGGGEHTLDDLASTQHRWLVPLGLDLAGHRVWTVPPPSQGALALAGAWVALDHDLPDDPADPRWAHLVVEAARAVGRDRLTALHDGADGDALLAQHRLAARAAEVDPERAAPTGVPVGEGDTTYLCAVDGDGMAVSLIQSNACDLGSRLFEPATGINLHARGIGFRLLEEGPGTYGPRRRPATTLSPTLVTDADGAWRACVGTMGGDAQPQIVQQLLLRLLHHGQPPGRAVGAARALLSGGSDGFALWEAPQDHAVAVEGHAPPGWAPGLEALGHRVVRRPAFDVGAGHAHAIVRTDDGLAGAADPRTGIGAALGR